jgi:hypothetical protein
MAPSARLASSKQRHMGMPPAMPLAVLLCAALLGTTLMRPAHAAHAWEGYHWARTGGSFTLKVVDCLTTSAYKVSPAGRAVPGGVHGARSAVQHGEWAACCSGRCTGLGANGCAAGSAAG